VTAGAPPSIWRRDIVGWSLYDFANTIYSMNIVSLYLKRYIVEDLGRPDHYFDIPFAISMFLAALLLPALGTVSDYGTKKKIFLLLFTITCCTAVGLLAVVPGWAILAVIVLFIIANFAYEAGQPFYNALLYSVAEGRQARLVSGVGVAWGYVGSIAGMILVLPFVTGGFFSIDVPFLEGGGKTAAFVPTAALFLLFSIPLFLWVRERPAIQAARPSIGQAYRDIWRTLRETRKYPGVLRFLVADYFFEDAVATVILNISLYCSLVLRLPEESISRFLIISTISAVVGSLAIGYLARFWSLKKLLYGIAIGWVIALSLFVATDNMIVVWILGSMVGILLGGLWTTTRPFLAEMVPKEELGKFFGLFSLSGRAAAVVGPLVWTVVVYVFQPERAAGRWLGGLLGLDADDLQNLPYKLAVLSLAMMVLVGLIIFRKVPESRGANDG
jgi:UMF1 family MFS transporter